MRRSSCSSKAATSCGISARILASLTYRDRCCGTVQNKTCLNAPSGARWAPVAPGGHCHRELNGIPLARARFMQRSTFFILTLCVLGSACDSSTSPTAPTLISTGSSTVAQGVTSGQSPAPIATPTPALTVPIPVLSPVPGVSLMPFPTVSTITVPGASPVPTNPIPLPAMNPVPISDSTPNPAGRGSSTIVSKH
jgi:hypothetical protein